MKVARAAANSRAGDLTFSGKRKMVRKYPALTGALIGLALNALAVVASLLIWGV